jgi:hypothetical protein
VAIVVGVLVVVGGGAAAAFFVMGGDGGGDVSTGSPQDTAEAFAQAWQDRDCEALKGLLTDQFLESGDGTCDPEAITGSPSDPEVTEESGDSATVAMKDGDVTFELKLVNEDGEWLVDGIGGSSTIEPNR